MEKTRKRIPLALRLNVLIIVIIFALAGGLTIIAYQVNSTRVDRYYKQTTANAAGTVAAFMDGDWFASFLEVLRSPEYQAVRAQGVEAEDESIVQAYLEEKGMYEKLLAVSDVLRLYRERLGAQWIYVTTTEGDSGSLTVLDPYEDLLYMGQYFDLPPEFEGIHRGERIEPTVSVTEYGWFCSAYEPFYDSDGNFVGLVGVDISMDDVMAERHQFLLQMILFAGVLLVVSVFTCVLMLRSIAIRPLDMLSKATVGFADSDEIITSEDIISLPLKNNDEIGDLYHVIQAMQTRIVEYLDNLTRVTAEKERIGAELNVATQIQADMLPRIFPAFPDRREFDIYATMDPAKEVGGDFYDFFLIDEDHMGLVMADVSGKGVPAALFMVIAKTLIKNRAMMGGGPAEILKFVNEQLCEGNEAELFVTVWLAVLEISTGKGLAANAGHEHPVIRRKDGTYELVVYRHAPAVATMEGLRFREHEFQLNPGDSLFVYTDGVPEATNASNELFGTDRMLAALNRNPNASPKELLNAVRVDIDAFVGGAPQFDDITMLGFDYFGQENEPVKELTVEAAVENLDEVLAFVDGYLQKKGCSMKNQMQLDVAVEELFVNIAHYAYKPGSGPATVQITAEPDPLSVVITFMDHGVPYDPLAKEDPDITLTAEERPIGGLGIFMVKKSMDNVAYEYKDGKNVLTIKKRIK